MLKKRILSLILCLLMTLSAFSLWSCAVEEDTLAILFENDVHCAVEGYAKLGAMKNELAESYDHVGVVSSGDFVQGGTLGAISQGEYIVDIINEVGYDAIALGNHEFDYKLDRLNELREKLNAKVLSCNFTLAGSDETYFDAYDLVEYGNVKIAYIGITTPETMTSSAPESKKPTLASATRRFSTPATNFSRILVHAVSRSSWQTVSTSAISQ